MTIMSILDRDIEASERQYSDLHKSLCNSDEDQDRVIHMSFDCQMVSQTKPQFRPYSSVNDSIRSNTFDLESKNSRIKRPVSVCLPTRRKVSLPLILNPSPNRRITSATDVRQRHQYVNELLRSRRKVSSSDAARVECNKKVSVISNQIPIYEGKRLDTPAEDELPNWMREAALNLDEPDILYNMPDNNEKIDDDNTEKQSPFRMTNLPVRQANSQFRKSSLQNNDMKQLTINKKKDLRKTSTPIIVNSTNPNNLQKSPALRRRSNLLTVNTTNLDVQQKSPMLRRFSTPARCRTDLKNNNEEHGQLNRKYSKQTTLNLLQRSLQLGELIKTYKPANSENGLILGNEIKITFSPTPPPSVDPGLQNITNTSTIFPTPTDDPVTGIPDQDNSINEINTPEICQ